jgi:hypothetical protein
MFLHCKIYFLKTSLILFFCFLSFLLAGTFYANASELSYELRGSFLIQAEENGEAWYVDHDNGLRHYLPSNSDSFKKMSLFGLGISNQNLAKIPIAVDSRLVFQDSDGDGLDDRLERAIGTDPFNSDSDGDGHRDDLELGYHYNPLGTGKLPIDLNLSARLSGRILLQTQANGEMWYVYPENNLRYYIADYQYLLKVIKHLGQGINNQNINYIADARLIREGMAKNIKIDVGSKQRLYYYIGDVQLGSFPVSAGKASTPTPRGEFKIINKHPKAWSSFGLWMPYWMGLGTGSFGLHELPIWPNGYREGQDHLGIPVSHGCIRLGIGPAQFLYNWAEVGTPVIIY